MTTPEPLLEAVRRRPFEPFRLVQTDGTGYDIRHPDLLFIGQRAVVVGLTGDPAQTLFERYVTLDLLHVIRVEPLSAPTQSGNGQT